MSVGYPMNVVTFARRLHEQNGWTAWRIRSALMERGYRPAHSTVLTWIDPEYRRARYERSRRPGSCGPARRHGWELRMERMQTLRQLGISYRLIAVLMSHDFEDINLTEHQVRAIFRGETSKKKTRELLWTVA